MYLMKKIMQNLFRNKGRNVIILALLAIGAISLVISLSVRDISKETMSAVKDYYSREVSIFPDVPDPANNVPENPPTLQDYQKFANSGYVQDFVLDILVTVSSSSGNLNGDITAFAVSDENSFNDLSYGQYVMSEGVFPADRTECIITSECARKNKLGIGDTLYIKETGDVLTITGVFSDQSTPTTATKNYRTPLQIKTGDIITVHGFANGFDSSYIVKGSFFLKSPDQANAFLNELRAKGLSDEYSVSFNQHRFQETMDAINKSTAVIMTYSLIVTLIGVGIVFLMNLFAMRGRRYEVGVLRANGMPKGKVLCLLMGEMLILASIAVVIALIIGALAQPAIISSVLQMSSGVPQSVKDMIFSASGSLTSGVIASVIGLITALVVLSDAATIGKVMQFDPIKILSERN